MGLLINGIVIWILRHFRNLIIIILVLVLGGKTKDFIQTEIEEYQVLSSDSTKLISEKSQLDQYIDTIANDVKSRTVQYESATAAKVGSRIAGINEEIKSKEGQRKQRGDLITLLRHRPVLDGFTDLLKLDAEIILLTQEKEWLSKIHKRNEAPISVEQARQKHISIYKDLKENETKLNKYKADHPLRIALTKYGLRADAELSTLKLDYEKLKLKNQKAREVYDKKYEESQLLNSGKRQFSLGKKALTDSLNPIKKAIEDREKDLFNNWVTQAKQPIEKVLPTALMILLTYIFGQIGLKAIFFYFLTPIASRRPPVVLLPQSSGLIDGMNDHPLKNHDRSKISSVSVKLRIEANQELLVHPEYIQSSTVTGRKDTKWLMDYSFPWSSLLSGMFALTRIRSNQSELVVLSASKDPLLEVGIISLPEGSSVVLQPSSLIGVAYDMKCPMRISRHWRIFSLQAWLTLQLRYLVFHGPAKLIVKGCRGVRVERADEGRLINQAATMGFCANLQYSTSRCDTFTSYLMGKQELLNDSFTGDTGYYIYEEMPHNGKHAGITGRGLEGFTEAVLRVFGV